MLVRIARVVSLLLALAACGWFAVGIRQAHDLGSADTILSGAKPISQPEARRVKTLIDGAALLNPDKQVQLLRGRLALALGETRRARAIFLTVAKQEPMNVLAWSLLGRAAGADRGLALLAIASVIKLEPPVKQAP